MGVSRRSQVGATHSLRASAAVRLEILGLDIVGLGIAGCSPTLLTT
ncbi:MAG TPA: hypothetical protein VGP04_12435 [Pseudonocardiaceae bacterium]|nr:hypothetical protein [Pseudonocardiaceae bacterium]